MARSAFKPSNLFTESFETPNKGFTAARLKNLLAKAHLKKKPEIVINRVNSFVLPRFLSKRVLVYNGNSLSSFAIKKSMVGLKFNNLIRTKKMGFSIHIDKRSKKKKSTK